MIGLVMCGGKGSRMNLYEEKLLLKYKKPMIQHVLDAMANSNLFSKIVCVTSNNSPKTRDFVMGLGYDILETSGTNYVQDLSTSLTHFHESVFVVSGDMPFLDSEIIHKIIQMTDKKNAWTSILVKKDLLDLLEVESEFLTIYNSIWCAYTGISIIDPTQAHHLENVKESYILIDDKRIAVNLNTRKEYDLFCAT